MSTETSCHFGHLLQISKKISLKSDFIHILFYDFVHVHCIKSQDRDRQLIGDKILMSTGRPYHFAHLLQVQKTFFDL